MGLFGRSAPEPDPRGRFEGPGGTPGGIGSFVLGLVMTVPGGYLILNQVQVTSGYWQWWGLGANTFGLTLIPLVLGVAILFFNSRNPAGWLPSGGGLVIIFAGILTSLQIFFSQTSLFNVLLMLVLFAAGLGLMARAMLRS